MITPYYNHGGITIYHGDCLKVWPVLTETFDAIICDPPYGITNCKWDMVIPLDQMWAQVKRTTSERAAIVFNAAQPFSSALVMSNLAWFKYERIWEKTTPTGFLNANKRPLVSHENILVFCQGQGVYNPQMRKGKKYTKKGTRTKLPDSYNSFTVEPVKSYHAERYPRSCQQYKYDKERSSVGAKQKRHPTQKPLSMIRDLVRTYTNPGDLILDFTMGSGTTLVAAMLEGRRAVGIEIDEEYCALAVERMRDRGLWSIIEDNAIEDPHFVVQSALFSE